MNDAQAREILRRAFIRYAMPDPRRSELQIVGAVGRFEGVYGTAWGGANNWGAIQCPHGPPCGNDCVEAQDTHAGGEAYQWCFKRYATPDDGAYDLLREMYRRKGVHDAARTGDARAVALAMYRTRYFEGHCAHPENRALCEPEAVGYYTKAILRNAGEIARNLKEPLAVRDGSSASSRTGAGSVVAGALLLVGAYVTARALKGSRG